MKPNDGPSSSFAQYFAVSQSVLAFEPLPTISASFTHATQPLARLDIDLHRLICACPAPLNIFGGVLRRVYVKEMNRIAHAVH
jgi:hypothetical protein